MYVIGITGASRSGKGWIASFLLQEIRNRGKTGIIVTQDDYWLGAKQVTVRGQRRMSEEHPECTDNIKFAAVISENAKRYDVVICEGFQLLYHSALLNLVTNIFFVDIDIDEARRRRTQPRAALLNPNPLSPADFDDLLWPEHEKYMRDKIIPLGESVTFLPCPRSQEIVNKHVHFIMQTLQI
jgi:uridine kinase